MNGTTLERPDVAAYLNAVRSRLADLPAEERDDLVADVEASLLESGEPPALSPEDFAAELREAAGLAPAGPAAPQPSLSDSLRSWLSSERASSLLRTGSELAPIWWLARAYVAVAVVALAAGWGWPLGSGTTSYTLSVKTSLLALFAATAASVWLGLLGRRERAGFRRVRLGVNIALALALVPVAAHSLDQLAWNAPEQIVLAAEPLPGLANDGVRVQNVYAFSRDGRPLFDVFLYDDRGMPLEVLGAPDPARRVLIGRDGTPWLNSYPIRYYEPGTTTVARPDLAPSIILPDEIVTPPLEPGR